MPNKILYSPQEGTTGLWGLRDVPPMPTKSFEAAHYISAEQEYNGALAEYQDLLESCKSNKLEIVNPEVIPNVPLWPGDIFDLPIGYEFKEELQQVSSTSHINPQWIEVSEEQAKQYPGFATRTVLRLVKTETKETTHRQKLEVVLERLKDFLKDEKFQKESHQESINGLISMITDGLSQGLVIIDGKWVKEPEEKQLTFCPKCGELKYKDAEHTCAVPQPEPEESQTEPIQNALYATGRFTTDECDSLTEGIIQYLTESGFTIQRKKQ